MTLAMSQASAAQSVEVDPALPAYEALETVSGTIKSIGSDTMNNLMALWGEGFRAAHPRSRSRSRARAPRPRRPR